MIFLDSKKTIFQHNRELRKRKYDIWSIRLYFSFVKYLTPLISSKSYDFILKIYLSIKKIFFFQKFHSSIICSRQLETLVRLSEAFGKLTLASKIHEFHIKAAARIMFDSFFPMNPIQRSGLMGANFLNEFNDSFSFARPRNDRVVKFHEFNFISKKILTVIDEKIGTSFLRISKIFFFNFSTNFKKKVGVKQIMKFIITIHHMTHTFKGIFFTKISKNSTGADPVLRINKF